MRYQGKTKRNLYVTDDTSRKYVRYFGLVEVKGLVEAAQREQEAYSTAGNVTTSP